MTVKVTWIMLVSFTSSAQEMTMQQRSKGLLLQVTHTHTHTHTHMVGGGKYGEQYCSV